MKYGVVLPIWRLTTAEAERMTLRAEELGWDGVFVPDHIMAKPATTEHYGPSWPDPFSLLAFLAFFIVMVAENGRLPVDNPATHLDEEIGRASCRERVSLNV